MSSMKEELSLYLYAFKKLSSQVERPRTFKMDWTGFESRLPI